MTQEQVDAFEANLVRRVRREPLAYVLGEWGFRRLTLRTDRRALIPRPETEIVVERALEHIRDRSEPDVLDVGTGTGAIALAIADEHEGARVTAIDVSSDALALARENLDLTGINGRVRLVEHDLTSGLGEAQFDLVVSNPPYVEPEELETLQPEVRDWEPHLALVAHGATEAVARAATEALRPGGWLVLESAAGAAERIRDALERLGYDAVAITPDLAGEGPGGRGPMDGLTTADGRRLAYRRTGQGPTLVCHGGGPGFSGLYLADLGGLDRELELVLLDPRGTGGSDRPADPRDYAIADYAADLEELREHLGLERMSLLGHSHGGVVAMALRGHAPRAGRAPDPREHAAALGHRAGGRDGGGDRGVRGRALVRGREGGARGRAGRRFASDEELGELGAPRVPVLLRALRRRGARLPRAACARNPERGRAAPVQPGDLRDVRPAPGAGEHHRADARDHRRGGLHHRPAVRSRDRRRDCSRRHGGPAGHRPLHLRRGARGLPRRRALVPGARDRSRPSRRSRPGSRSCSRPTPSTACARIRRTRRLRRRSTASRAGEARQPTALLARDVEALLERVPELRGPVESRLRALLPGPFTLVVPNPARRFPWLAGERPDTIGVRVPVLDGPAAEVLDRVGAVLATSANLAGGRDPRRLDEVPEEIRSRCGALVDGGELPGTPSTVLDLTGPEPRVLREGAVPAAEAIERALAATGGRQDPMRELAAPRRRHVSDGVAQETHRADLRTAGLAEVDPEIAELLGRELERQRGQIELIASENFTWPSILEAVGSVPTNKYAEGYPGKRYYGGCEVVDEIEQTAIDRAKELFGAEHANVQPHAGAQTNMAVYMAALEPGDTILSLQLDARRPPHARAQGQLLRPALHDRALRRQPRDERRRLRRGARGSRSSTGRS